MKERRKRIPVEFRTHDLSVWGSMRCHLSCHPGSEFYIAPRACYSYDVISDIFLCIGLICSNLPIANCCLSRKAVPFPKQGYYSLTTGRSNNCQTVEHSHLLGGKKIYERLFDWDFRNSIFRFRLFFWFLLVACQAEINPVKIIEWFIMILINKVMKTKRLIW